MRTGGKGTLDGMLNSPGEFGPKVSYRNGKENQNNATKPSRRSVNAL